MVVIDPPFITREVWVQYAKTAELLLRKDEVSGMFTGRVICTTIAENEEMIGELFSFLLDEERDAEEGTAEGIGGVPKAGVLSVKFRPSIPNLVYQYKTYTNYHSERLAKKNNEIPGSSDSDDD